MARKLTILLLPAAALLCSCAVKPSVTDLERYQMTGKVLRAEVDLGEGYGYTAWFDRRGMLDSLVQVNPTETLSNVYIYDSKGHLKEHAIYRPDRHYEGYYLYNYKGDVVESYTLFGWDLQAIFDWKFDVVRGRQQRCRYYNEGTLVSTTEYSWFPGGKMETVYDTNGNPCGELTYRYLDRFRLSGIEGEDVHIEIEYGEDGLPASSRGGVVESDSEVSTNSEIRFYGSMEYHYEKDSRGNWTRREEYFPGPGVSGRTITRKITYR